MPAKVLKLRPDAKGRILLGRLADGVSSFTVISENGRIILEPNIEIPAKERWLWENKKALEQVRRGLRDSAKGHVKSKGKFSGNEDD